MSKTKKIATSLISMIFLVVLYYLLLPTMSLMHFDGFIYTSICILVLVLNICVWIRQEIKDVVTPVGITVAVIIVLFVIGLIARSVIFNANTMQQQLGDVEKIEYQDMIKQIDTSQIPIVDQKLALKQADKKVGEDPTLGSRIDLGQPAIQNVNGELIWVIPMEHSGFFKWMSNKSTPGYVTVSAYNANKVELVTEVNGDKLNITYQQSAYGGNDLKRHIRNEGNRSMGLTEYTFELDDTGRPYWVVTTYENKTLWRNGEATGVVVVDAQTGETNNYTVEDAPEWVDIIQPESFIENQINHWGELIHGAFNFSDRDKIRKTNLVLTVYVEGECYYFTGMTSVGGDNSCVGFIMVNTRNKKSYMSYMSGATEDAAMSSAEGLVSDFGYKATEPLPINVNGIPTYVMALKDGEGLIKSYAMVNIQNYSISAKGTTLEENKRAYMQKVNQESSTYVFSDEAYGYTYEGKIERISAIVENGSTQYYLILENLNNIFTASYAVSNELAITREGDSVKIGYIDDQNGVATIVSFDNIAFSEKVSEEQLDRDKLDEGTSALDQKLNN